jgi:hypothetical protein
VWTVVVDTVEVGERLIVLPPLTISNIFQCGGSMPSRSGKGTGS